MKHWRVWLLLVGIGTLQLGCSKGNSDAAIRQAIEQHLSGRPGLNNSDMVMEVKKVQVEGDKADADVVFRSRTDPKASMDFHYKLHREGNAWKVEAPAAMGGGAPHAMPPSDGAPGELPSDLPPGHPPMGQQPGGAVPEGHPPTGEQPQKK